MKFRDLQKIQASLSPSSVPCALESGVHVVAVGEGVAGEQLQVPQVRRVRRPAEARVVRAVLWIVWEEF